MSQIAGVFFNSHAYNRFRQRIASRWDNDVFEQKIVDLEGRYYWDEKHENCQVVFEDVVFAFSLKLHDSRPGLLAYVETALVPGRNAHEENDRFTRLRPTKNVQVSETRLQKASVNVK